MTTETDRHTLFVEAGVPGGRRINMYAYFPYEDGVPGHRRIPIAVLHNPEFHGPAGEHNTYQIDVPQTGFKQEDGDDVRAARYTLSDVTLAHAWDTNLSFSGWLTTMRRYEEGRAPFQDPYRDHYPYLPPRVETTHLPVRVEFTITDGAA